MKSVANTDSNSQISSLDVVPTLSRGDDTDSSGDMTASERDPWTQAVDTLAGSVQDPDEIDPDYLNSATDSNLQISSLDVIPTSNRSDDTDSSGDMITSERDPWKQAVDTLLGWYKDPDEIDADCLNSAIDFASDQRDDGVSPPSSIIATDDGEITFEWRRSRLLIMVTILASGLAEYTKLHDCRVVDEGLLRRDPLTRKLQLESM